MAPSRPFTYCEGAPSWNPTTYIADTALHERAEAHLASDDLQSAITVSFSLPPPHLDPYVYHAIVSVTLPEVQHVISLGGQNGLHSWYFAPAPASAPSSSSDNSQNNNNGPNQPPRATPATLALPPPPRPDTEAYLSIFDPGTSTPAAALKTFLSNAKKGSLRGEIAAYLQSKRYLHATHAPTLAAPKKRASKNKPKPKTKTTNTPSTPPNPYLTFLSWSARALEWAGPSPAATSSTSGSRAHHVLPVLMHHFGCACPTHEALLLLRAVAAGREVLDVGSGGGYWTFQLRAYGVRAVAVDSGQSAWRVNWVEDTQIADGAAWLRRRRKNSSSSSRNRRGVAAAAPDPDEGVLLLVYPIVGGSVAGDREGGFTRDMLDAYAGDTVAVVGTQNRGGYTGFRGESMDEYMQRERAADGWVKVVQVALPSFPGKDEALFVFQRGSRAPARDTDTDVAEATTEGTVAPVPGGVHDGSCSNDDQKDI